MARQHQILVLFFLSIDVLWNLFGCVPPPSQSVCFQEVLDAAETKLPLTLRIERKLRVIGQYFICPDDQTSSPNENQEGKVDFPGAERSGNRGRREEGYLATSEETGSFMKPSGVCSGRRSGQIGENDQKFDSMASVWSVVSARKSSTKRNGLEWIPYLRSISWGGRQLFVKYHVCTWEAALITLALYVEHCLLSRLRVSRNFDSTSVIMQTVFGDVLDL